MRHPWAPSRVRGDGRSVPWLETNVKHASAVPIDDEASGLSSPTLRTPPRDREMAVPECRQSSRASTRAAELAWQSPAVAEDLFVDSDGVRLAVRDYGGSGPAVVLVHGHYGNLGSFDYLGPLLVDHGLRAVAYDQRGHGWSERGPVSVATYTADLAAVVQALGLTSPVLYGGSFGTLVCLGFFHARGQARGFISEDGRVADFPRPAQPPAPPRTERRVLTREEWRAVESTFAAAGPTGVATATRARVLMPDGTVEVRPTAADLFAKEQAFTAIPIGASWAAAPDHRLLLATEKAPDPARRRENVAALQAAAGLDVEWFAAGHWISAEATVEVARRTAAFVHRM